ncbi:DNA polymerase IV [Paenibacillus sp. Leaf72]|uniref:DNA polymerase IV n=1 Tax=Paenibacillus sp. Leaf72 TaxID=1736234 RepID=UPI0006F9DBC4|nr:DNA polymerase IV [Paenibacillus sp. Leaf72]KQN96934.1 DNA polymerase IV [Paenibacillus sp. Leaf72]
MQSKSWIALIDIQAFYASVEKSHNPQYANKPLVVASDPARRTAPVIAACPLAKAKGVKTGDRIGEALAKCPNLIIVRPRMEEYIKISMQITNIYKSYTNLVEVFSIDEQLLDITGSLHFFNYDVIKMATDIQRRVFIETGLVAKVGLSSSSKILAQMATSCFAKKNATGIFILEKEDLPHTLWTLPIDQMFMVGSQMRKHFLRMGIYSIGDLANTPLPTLKNRLRARLGKNSDITAELYWRIANGISQDSFVDPHTHEATPKSISNQITLPYGLNREDVTTPLLELAETVCQRCRNKKLMGSTVSLSCQGSDYERPTGFSSQVRLLDPTNITNQVFRAAVQLLHTKCDNTLIRRVSLSLSNLVEDNGYQISIFDDIERPRALERITDSLKQKYGDTIIMRASSLLPAGQARDRGQKIGGHFR